MIKVIKTYKDLSFVSTASFDEKIKLEFAAALTHFTGKKATGTFPFECYKHTEIKQQLAKDFNKKCGFCDSSMLHVSFGDIEHFRPKSIYWWLASNWNNLLFACERCNRAGKKDHFPLLNGATTQCNHTDHHLLQQEDKKLRLLLNPCIDNGEDFLAYDNKEASVFPHPSLTKRNKKHEMAVQSIAVYQLQRHDLIEERKKTLLLLHAQIDYVKRTITEYNKMRSAPTTVASFYLQSMRKALEGLMIFNEPNRPYLGMVRQELRRFFDENKIPLPKSLKP